MKLILKENEGLSGNLGAVEAEALEAYQVLTEISKVALEIIILKPLIILETQLMLAGLAYIAQRNRCMGWLGKVPNPTS